MHFLYKRRQFITLLGGAAVSWPVAARAQKADRMRRIGVLNTFAAEDPEGQARIAALLQALQPLGWTVGTTCASTTDGEPGTPRPPARTLRNWSRSHPTSSSQAAPQAWDRCWRRPAACR